MSYGYAGVIRDTDVLIGDSTYVPMSGEEDGKNCLTEQLGLVIKKANAITNIFERSLFLLLHVSYLQAFIDVNKRTARQTGWDEFGAKYRQQRRDALARVVKELVAKNEAGDFARKQLLLAA